MRRCNALSILRIGLPASGVILVNGCLTGLQQNLDLLLSPGAVENALRLPFSGIAPLANLLFRLLG